MAKILVVDDNLANCDLLADVLSQWGYEVAQAHQGKKVLPMVEAFRPDLVLLDVMLPGMNGFEICKRIKASAETENIAVILLTVLNDVEDRAQGIRVGADLFLSKPVNYKELRRQIEFVLSNKTHMEELEESEAICECLLRLMSHLDAKAYCHSLTVKEYAKKLAMRLELSERSIKQAAMGAALHDLKKMLPERTASDEAVLEILQPLKMLHWLKPYLTKKKSGILDVQIVQVVNAYCKLCEEGVEEKTALERVRQAYGAEYGTSCEALEQLIADEQFLKNIGL